MDKLSWCLKQNKGIRKIIPNENLSEAYLKRAKKDFDNINGRDVVWSLIISYYSCYNALYSVLLRYGIKCEIHSCSIDLMDYFENLKEHKYFMKRLKKNRINTQYYLKKPEKVDLKEIKKFLLLCEIEIEECNAKKIENLNIDFTSKNRERFK